jgi:hypothetical protein
MIRGIAIVGTPGTVVDKFIEEGAVIPVQSL